MNSQQLDKLSNVVKRRNFLNGLVYFYDIELPYDTYNYRPVLSKNGVMYDYYKLAKEYLKKQNDINKESALNLFFSSTCDSSAKHFSLCKITPEKAQSLINRTVALFAQIRNKIIENSLIDEINKV